MDVPLILVEGLRVDDHVVDKAWQQTLKSLINLRLVCCGSPIAEPLQHAVHSKRAQGVLIAIFSTSSLCTGVWKNALVRSILPSNARWLRLQGRRRESEAVCNPLSYSS